MNTKRTLTTLISASLLTLAAAPVALASGPTPAADQATVKMAQATDQTTVAMQDEAIKPKSDMKQAADDATDVVSDNWIQGKLEASFMADDNLSSFAINTQVIDGVATLTGHVDSKANVDHATKVAKSIKGITGVKNLLMVEAPEKNRTTADMDDATEPKSGVNKTADKATGAVTDTWVQGKLKTALFADESLSGFAINTEVKDGVATLVGNVDSKADIDRATKLAKSIEGIISVKNSLVVKPSDKNRTAGQVDRATDRTAAGVNRATNRTTADMDDAAKPKSDMKQAADDATDVVTDNWIQGKLEAAFMADDHLSSFAIDTQVIDGVATLTGNVETKADIDRATKVAKSIKGITSVNNSLVVEPSE